MKQILLLALSLLVACKPNQETGPEAFDLKEVRSVLLSVNGKSDIYKMVENRLFHKFNSYYLAETKTNDWLTKLSKIESMKTQHPGAPLTQRTLDAIEITLMNGTRFLYQGGHTDEAYYVFVQKLPADPKGFSRVIYLTKENYRLIFPETKSLRVDKIPFDKVERIQYQQNGSTFDLDPSQFEVVKDVLSTAAIVDYPHSGEVTKEIEEAFVLGEKINGNIPGNLILISKEGSMSLKFGKPQPHSSETYIYVKGRNEIYTATVKNWEKLEMLVGVMVNKRN